jgi:hypothetical protein
MGLTKRLSTLITPYCRLCNGPVSWPMILFRSSWTDGLAMMILFVGSKTFVLYMDNQGKFFSKINLQIAMINRP